MRALLALSNPADISGAALKRCAAIAKSEDIPVKFLEGILQELQKVGLLESKRGSKGGYRLAVEPSEISVADVIRALEGPLADVSGQKPEDLTYESESRYLKDVWVALRAAIREVLEETTLEQIRSGSLNEKVRLLTSSPEAWRRRQAVAVRR